MTTSKRRRNSFLFFISTLLLAFLVFQYLIYPRLVDAGVSLLTPTGTFGMDTTAIAVSPSFPCDNTVFFATDGQGIFRTTDTQVDGVWYPVNNGLTSLSVLSLAISPNFDRCDKLQGTGDKTLFAGTRNGLFKSTDAGATWLPVGPGIPTDKPVQAVSLSPNYASDNTLFVGMDGSLLRSTDNGATWLPFDAGLTDRSVQAFATSANFANDSTLFLGTRFSGVYRIAAKVSNPPTPSTAGGPTPSGTPGASPSPSPTATMFPFPIPTTTAQGTIEGGRSEAINFRVSSTSCINGTEGLRVTAWAGNAADGSVFRTSAGPVSFSYEIDNIGTTALRNLVLNDDNGTPGNGSDDINVTLPGPRGSIGDLAPEGVIQLNATIPVTQTSTHRATAVGFFGADLAGSISCSDDASVQVVTGGPNVSMKLVVRAGNAADGAVLTTPPGPVAYTYEIRNAGDVTLSDIAVKDDSGTSGDTSDDIHIGTIPSLAAGANNTLTANNSVTGDRNNRATATARFGPGFDQVITATDTAEVKIITSQPVRGLKLIKTAGNAPDGQIYYTVPGPVILTYTIINEGQETLTNIRVLDDTQGNDGPGCTDNAATTDVNETQDDMVVGTVNGLAPGGQAVLSARIVIKPEDELGTEFKPLRTTACAIGTGAGSGGPSGAVDDAVIQLIVWQSITPSNSALTDLWITSFAVSPFFANDQTILAGTAYGGLFKSSNAGSSSPTWTRVNQGLEPEWVFVRAVALSPRYPNDRTLFIGTENGVFMGVEQTDGRVVWTELSRGLTRKDVRSMAISPNYQVDHAVWSAVWDNDVYRFQDGGDSPSWIPQRKIVGGLWDWDVAMTKEGVVLAGTWGLGVGRNYIPGGTGWSYPVLPGAADAEVTALEVSPGICTGYTIMAGTWAHGLYQSADAGATWRTAANFPGNVAIRDIQFSPNFVKDGTLFVATWGNGVYKSGDMGNTWSNMSNGLTDLKIRTIALPPNYPQDSSIFAGTDAAGVMRWEPLISKWVPINLGLNHLTVMSLATSPTYNTDFTILAGTWGDGLYTSRNRGSSWTKSTGGIANPYIRSVEFSQSFARDRMVYVGTHEGGYRSSDGGYSWNLIASEKGELDKIDITGFAISEEQPTTLFVSTGGRGIWQYTEGSTVGTASAQPARAFAAKFNVNLPLVSKGRVGSLCSP
ncbi:MAG: hypothetical protein EXR50_01125 [Dehalococcoidia bacterium]|nr:hypothetical protein [Dehalococcoidia bacterium]